MMCSDVMLRSLPKILLWKTIKGGFLYVCTMAPLLSLLVLCCCASAYSEHRDICMTPIEISSNFSISVCRDPFNDYISYKLRKSANNQTWKLQLTECDFYSLFFGHSRVVAGVQTSLLHYNHHILRPSCYDVLKGKINDKWERLRTIKYAAKMLKHVLKSIRRTPDDLAWWSPLKFKTLSPLLTYAVIWTCRKLPKMALTLSTGLNAFLP